MQRLTIARFDVVRTANIVAALYAVIFVVIGLLIAVPIMIRALAAGRDVGPGVAAGGVIGGLALLVFAVGFYVGIGWVVTAVVCLLYNALAGRIGGIRVDVQPEGPASMGSGAPGWPAAAPLAAPSSPPITGGPPQPPSGWGAQG